MTQQETQQETQQQTQPIRHIVVITGDPDLPDPTKHGSRYAEVDLNAHQHMVDAMAAMDGYDIEVWTDHATLLERLVAERPDLVVNFCDTGYRNVPTLELHVPAFLDLHGIPYTGAAPAALVTCYDKAIVRLVAAAHGVDVPAERFIANDLPAEGINGPFPALLKPNRGDGSVGITKDAVVRNAAEAARYLKWMRSTLPGVDALLQEYLPGTEYGVGVIGNPDQGLRILPAMQVDYSRLPAGLDPILSFESKTEPDSPYWTDIGYKRAELDAEREAALGRTAAALFRRLGLRDYGRFDFRTGADGVIRLMEINPNPAWGFDCKLAFMASFSGIKYAEMLRAIIDAAVARLRPDA